MYPVTERANIPIRLESGEQIDGSGPVVVVGPNGSGKTRQARNITADAQVEIVNALRNTRVAPELPAMGFDTARNNYRANRDQARHQPWELTSEFDSMLSQLLAGDAMTSKEFVRQYRLDPTSAGMPAETPLSRVENIWSEVFPGRILLWRDWKPVVRSTTTGAAVEYTGNQMSDGEKAALFVASRVFSTEPGVVLVVDEPETHFHSLLAVRLWNALESARPDLRFVFVTHDLTFALSRPRARYVIASPTAGLKAIELDADLPSDIAEALLGAASLSFYASRIVFCEGEEGSIDARLFGAWFNGADTVVRPVGGGESVIRCVQAMAASGIAVSLQAIGIIDRDFRNDTHLGAMPQGVDALTVHEVESLVALPGVVRAVCRHTGQGFDEESYLAAIRGSVNGPQRHAIVVRRWKARIEPLLIGLVASVSTRQESLESLVDDMPTYFGMDNWDFSPQQILEEEKGRVETALSEGNADALLEIVPGKQLVPIAAQTAGLSDDAYISLVVNALNGEDSDFGALAVELEGALVSHLPVRAHSSPYTRDLKPSF